MGLQVRGLRLGLAWLQMRRLRGLRLLRTLGTVSLVLSSAT